MKANKKSPAKAGRNSCFVGNFFAPKRLQLPDEFIRLAVFGIDFNLQGLGQIEAENSHDGFRINLIFIRGEIDGKMIVVCQRNELFNGFNTG
jgi:hypothetical protein